MKDWKTSLAGLIAGVPVFINALSNAISAGQFTGKTATEIVISIGIILFGLWAKDSSNTVLQNPIVKASLPIAGEVVNLESKDHPTNQLLGDIKNVLGTIAANQAAPATTIYPEPATQETKV